MQPLRQTDRAFGLMFATALVVVSTIAWFVFDALLSEVLVAAAAFFVLALIAPGVLLPFNRLWGRFAHRLGRINNTLLLGLFFFLFVLPTGLIIRLFGNDPMQRKFEADKKSYWTAVGRHTDRDTFPDMF
jgi:hypothetical protein